MRSTSKALLLGLAAILAARLFAMAVMPLADTSEPRYAEIARLMAVTGDWVTPWFEPGVPFWEQAAAGVLGAGAVHQAAGSVRVQPAPAGLRRHAGRAGAGPCLRRPPVRRQRRALGRTGVRHHAAAAGQRRRGADRSLPGAGRDAVDDVFPAGATRRPRGGAMASSWVWRSACCPRGRWPWCWWRPPCCPGRCCPPDARSGARCPGSAARS